MPCLAWSGLELLGPLPHTMQDGDDLGHAVGSDTVGYEVRYAGDNQFPGAGTRPSRPSSGKPSS